MICTGMFFELWTSIIKYISNYIYISNPTLPIYISKRIDDFKNIVKGGYIDNELNLRNNEKIRRLFAELISIIVTSKQRNKLNDIKVNKDDFSIHEMSSKFIAKDTILIDTIQKKEDPKETYMAFNEFAYNISSKSKNSLLACYWIEWIIEYDSICKKKKVKCECERRECINVESKFQMSIVWILWEIILKEAQNRGKIYYKICNSLLDIFCLRYSFSNNKKFKGLLYYSVYVLCENVNISSSFIHNKDLVNVMISKIDNFYKQVKTNEKSPNTDYLFHDISKESNHEKSIRKLEIMNSIKNIN
jgi:hypothetical protein